MKNIANKLLIMIIAVYGICGCDSYLDQQPVDLPTTTDDVFADRSKTEQALYRCYSWMPKPWLFTSSAEGWAWDACSDVVFVAFKHQDKNIRNGSWNPSDVPFAQWSRMYSGISDCNYFIANVDKCAQLTDADKTTYKAEARFLRAYMYNILIRLYGPVVLMGDEVIDANNVIEKGRNTFEECVEYVADEFLEASKVLPVVWSDQWTGKPTKGAALGMRSQLLLFAASPLFNPKGESLYKGWVSKATGEDLMPQAYDANKWKVAAEAAKLVLDIPEYSLVVKKDKDGKIDPFASLRGVFLDDWNSEILWGRYGIDGNGMKRFYPYCWKNGWGGYATTQTLVDAFAMDNGRYPITGYSDDTEGRGKGLKPIIDPASGYKETGGSDFVHPYDLVENFTFNMYVHREPRFYTNIFYDGLMMPFNVNESQYPENKDGVLFTQINYGKCAGNKDGNASKSTNTAPCGYGVRTWVSRECDPIKGNLVFPVMPFIRLAEVYLNYVEALVEYGDLGNPDILIYWNKIRERAGVPDIEDVYPAVMNDKDILRELVRRERLVELPFENLRYFDLKRWQIADKVLPGPTYGMNIMGIDGTDHGESSRDGKGYDGKHPGVYNKIKPGSSYFKRTEQVYMKENYVFESPKHYLYPIAQGELDRNSKIEQAPGW